MPRSILAKAKYITPGHWKPEVTTERSGYGKMGAMGGMGVSHNFCRELCREVMPEVRQLFTTAQIKKAWVWTGDRKHWEFHGPHGEFFHDLKAADCAWSAKAEGWSLLLEALETVQIDPNAVRNERRDVSPFAFVK